MSVVVIGLNHRTAPLDLLERMAIGDGQLGKALHDLTTREHISEALVLSMNDIFMIPPSIVRKVIID